MDRLEADIREKSGNLTRKEQEKKEENKKEVDEMKKDLGSLKDKYKQSLRDVKTSIGSELFNKIGRAHV